MPLQPDRAGCAAFDGTALVGPLSDDDPDIAPELTPLRRQLMDMVHRPVNIQGTRDWLQHFRGDIMNQPYLILFGAIQEP